MRDLVGRAIVETLSNQTGYGMSSVEKALTNMIEDAVDDRVDELERKMDAMKASFTKEIQMLQEQIGELSGDIRRAANEIEGSHE